MVDVFTPELFAELIQQMKAGDDSTEVMANYMTKWVLASIEALRRS